VLSRDYLNISASPTPEHKWPKCGWTSYFEVAPVKDLETDVGVTGAS